MGLWRRQFGKRFLLMIRAAATPSQLVSKAIDRAKPLPQCS